MTKHCNAVLDREILRLRGQVMRKICGDFGAELREFDDAPTNHVHLLVR